MSTPDGRSTVSVHWTGVSDVETKAWGLAATSLMRLWLLGEELGMA